MTANYSYSAASPFVYIGSVLDGKEHPNIGSILDDGTIILSGCMNSNGIQTGVQVSEYDGSNVLNSNVSYLTANLGCNCQVISDDAFSDCYHLHTLIIPNVTTVGYNAFKNCDSLSIVDMQNVTTVKSGAFLGCTSVSVLNVPLAKYIGNYAFNGINAECLKFPKAKNIGKRSFANCKNAKNIIFNSLNTIGEYAFAGSGMRYMTINALEIPEGMCYGCKNLILFTSSATAIKAKAFYCCTSLEYVELNSAKTIEYQAFAYCTKLKSISLPKIDNAESIGSNVFLYCISLNELKLTKMAKATFMTIRNNLGLNNGCKVTCANGTVVIG